MYFRLRCFLRRDPRHGAENICAKIHVSTDRFWSFAEEIKGVDKQAADPLDCVPRTLDRDRYVGGVEKMKRILIGVQPDGTIDRKGHISAGG